MIEGFKDSFKQPGYAAYSHIEQLLFNDFQRDEFKDDLDFSCNIYTNDLQKTLLEFQHITFMLDFISYGIS